MKKLLILSIFLFGCTSDIKQETPLDICIKSCKAMGKYIDSFKSKGDNFICYCGKEIKNNCKKG